MEKQLTAEERIDSELEYEMAKVRGALADDVGTCNECGATLTIYDVDSDECPECFGNDFSVVSSDEPRSPDEYIERLLELVPQYTLYRAQISTGGPGDQFELYVDEDGEIAKIAYVFLPWFDRAERVLFGQNFADVKAIFADDIYFRHMEVK